MTTTAKNTTDNEKISAMQYTLADTAYCYSVGLNYDMDHYVLIETNLDTVDNILVDKSSMTIKINKVKYVTLSLDKLQGSLLCSVGNTGNKKSKINENLTHGLICEWLLDNHEKITKMNPMIGLFIGFLQDTINDGMDKSRVLNSNLDASKIVEAIKDVEEILQRDNISYPLPFTKLINFLKVNDLY